MENADHVQNRACGACGTVAPAGAKFCGECGTALARAARSAEYKQVTVLFADVVRSMELAGRLDPERLRDVITDLVERAAAAARRCGAGTVEYTGDGVMALFGAPAALEDHAVRACRAALAIQDEVAELAPRIERTEGAFPRVRVGLNSGTVIAGEIRGGSHRYAATGDAIGFAQRMEAAAPPGGILLSEATVRLVEHAVTLAGQQRVRIKGVADPVPARLLLAIPGADALTRVTETMLVGRTAELALLEAQLNRAVAHRGAVVTVTGAPGVGKSRLARSTAALAADRGVDTLWGFCESHARGIPLHAIGGLLRAGCGVTGLAPRAARERLRKRYPESAPLDLLLLHDLLGIADAGVPPPALGPEDRRRRVTALLTRLLLHRDSPAVLIIEDVHWIDPASESVLTDLIAGVAESTSLLLLTARPEYRGPLAVPPGAQSVVIDPLDEAATAMLLDGLLGPDPSLGALPEVIAARAAGNPFFIEEIVRDLVRAGVLEGDRGRHTCRAVIEDVAVPPTITAAVAAGIDRLGPAPRRTLAAAAVIGDRFDIDLLAAVLAEPETEAHATVRPRIAELLDAELIAPVGALADAFTFRHPLIRAVAYESQLKSERAVWHRRVAAAVQHTQPESVDRNAALIAQHLQSAGDDRDAYDWLMRAGAWTTTRDRDAARDSWKRAQEIADGLSDDAPDRTARRIAPRAMLCATDWLVADLGRAQTRFDELEDLCAVAGDKRSLAIGMTGPASVLCYAGHAAEAAAMSSRQISLLEPFDDPGTAIGVATIAFVNWLGVGADDETLRTAQAIIDLSSGDPTRGAGYGIESPLAIAMAWRGTARWWRGLPGWRTDLTGAVELARGRNAATTAGAFAWSTVFAIQYGIMSAAEDSVSVGEIAVAAANRAGDDAAISLASYGLAAVLFSRGGVDDRRRARTLMGRAGEIWSASGAHFLRPVVRIWLAHGTAAERGADIALPVMREEVADLRRAGHVFYRVWATGVLVETLLTRGAVGDIAEAELTVRALEDEWTDDGAAIRGITLLRLRAMLAGARKDPDSAEAITRYRDRAQSLGYDGHIAWAKAMAERAGCG